MLVLAGHEGCHVVECNCFHRSEFGRNGRFLLCLPSIPGFPKIASVLTPVIYRWLVIYCIISSYSLAWVAPARCSLNQLQADLHAIQQPCILVTNSLILWRFTTNVFFTCLFGNSVYVSIYACICAYANWALACACVYAFHKLRDCILLCHSKVTIVVHISNHHYSTPVVYTHSLTHFTRSCCRSARCCHYSLNCHLRLCLPQGEREEGARGEWRAR